MSWTIIHTMDNCPDHGQLSTTMASSPLHGQLSMGWTIFHVMSWTIVHTMDNCPYQGQLSISWTIVLIMDISHTMDNCMAIVHVMDNYPYHGQLSRPCSFKYFLCIFTLQYPQATSCLLGTGLSHPLRLLLIQSSLLEPSHVMMSSVPKRE